MPNSKTSSSHRRQSQWHPAWASVTFNVTPGSIPVVFIWPLPSFPRSLHSSIASFLAPESQKTQFFSKIRSLHRQNSTLRWTQTLYSRKHELQCIARKDFSPFVKILSRCGEIRSDRSLLGTRSAENHEKSMVFIEFLDDATRSSQTEKLLRSKCIEESAANFVAPEHA